MRHTLVVAIVLALGVTVSAAGASTKFSSTPSIDDGAYLVVSFEEGSQKRFATVDYQLDAQAEVSTPNMISAFTVTGNAQLVPDERGRVSGNIATTLDLLAQVSPCGCTGPRQVEYGDITLTNVTTRRVYRLDPIVRGGF